MLSPVRLNSPKRQYLVTFDVEVAGSPRDYTYIYFRNHAVDMIDSEIRVKLNDIALKDEINKLIETNQIRLLTAEEVKKEAFKVSIKLRHHNVQIWEITKEGTISHGELGYINFI